MDDGRLNQSWITSSLSLICTIFHLVLDTPVDSKQVYVSYRTSARAETLRDTSKRIYVKLKHAKHAPRNLWIIAGRDWIWWLLVAFGKFWEGGDPSAPSLLYETLIDYICDISHCTYLSVCLSCLPFTWPVSESHTWELESMEHWSKPWRVRQAQ